MTHNPQDGLRRTSVKPSTPKNSAKNVPIKNSGMKNDYFLTLPTSPRADVTLFKRKVSGSHASFRRWQTKSTTLNPDISLLTGMKRHVCSELVSGSHQIECQVKFCKIQTLPNQYRTQHITPKHKAQGSWVKAISSCQKLTSLE